MLVLRFDVEGAYALRQESPTEANWRKWVDETLAAVSSICTVLNRQHVPATFFVVGLLLERSGSELASLLRANPMFDIESHSYSHMYVKPDCASTDDFRGELLRTSALILDYFGRAPIGFCAPGNYYQGLRGQGRQLAVLWEQGYRFTGSDGQSARGFPFPAPFTQPYWYEDDGFPDLLELPLTGWHCNALFNSGHQVAHWQPASGFPDGGILDRLPTTIEEGFRVRKKELDHAIENDLIYAPAMHPWSVYRFDPELRHLERLIVLAKERGVRIANCMQLYETLKHSRSG